MKYLISENADSLIHVSSGQLLNQKNFIHERRDIDTFVIIICMRGTLYIAQDEKRFTLNENQFIILFAGHEHYGYRKCDGYISYYWCHFRVQDDRFRIISDAELAGIFEAKIENLAGGAFFTLLHPPRNRQDLFRRQGDPDIPTASGSGQK